MDDGGRDTTKTLYQNKTKQAGQKSRCGRKEYKRKREGVGDGGRDTIMKILHQPKPNRTEQVWEEGKKSWYERESG